MRTMSLHVIVKPIVFLVETIALGLLVLRAFFDSVWRAMLPERLGFGGWSRVAPREECVWIHAASVGEVRGIEPVISAIRRDFPELWIMVTTTSVTGRREVLERRFCETPCLLPLDHPLTMRRIIRKLKPKLVIITETELWPSLFFALAARRVPLMLVNARISHFSFPMYRRFSMFTQATLRCLTKLLVQTNQDATRFLLLGAKREAIEVVGSTKYDRTPADSSETDREQLVSSLGLERSRPCFVAGSVRPTEDASVIAAYLLAREVIPNLQMVIAPRHPERFELVAELLERYQVPFARRSEGPAQQAHSVVLLDTIGELDSIYSIATCAFIGGTLANFGGHNPLEAAAFAVPIIVGPHIGNIRDAVSQLESEQGVLKVSGSAELADCIIQLCNDPSLRERTGSAAHRVWNRNIGATRDVRKWIRFFLLDVEAAERELQRELQRGKRLVNR